MMNHLPSSNDESTRRDADNPVCAFEVSFDSQGRAGRIACLTSEHARAPLCFAQIPRSGDHDCAPVALQEQQRSQARAMNIVQQIFIPVRLDQFGDRDRDKAIGVFLFPLAHEFQDRLVNLPVG